MLYNSGHNVCVWSALEKEVESLSAIRRHPNLPGMEIPKGIYRQSRDKKPELPPDALDNRNEKTRC